MKLRFLFFIFITSIMSANGQFNCRDSSTFETYKNKTHNIVGLVPSNARVTNGLAIGWSISISDYCGHMNSIRINGAYINISPFQAFVAGMGLVMLPFALLMPNPNTNHQIDTSIYIQTSEINQLNGFALSLFEVGEDFTFSGLHINILYNNSDNLNGVSSTTIYNKYKKFSGLMLTGIYNKTLYGKGVQVGLINNAKSLRGVQIGLWNKIGKRGIPIINMSFKQK
jgi:hypothetical protein